MFGESDTEDGRRRRRGSRFRGAACRPVHRPPARRTRLTKSDGLGISQIARLLTNPARHTMGLRQGLKGLDNRHPKRPVAPRTRFERLDAYWVRDQLSRRARAASALPKNELIADRDPTGRRASNEAGVPALSTSRRSRAPERRQNGILRLRRRERSRERAWWFTGSRVRRSTVASLAGPKKRWRDPKSYTSPSASREHKKVQGRGF